MAHCQDPQVTDLSAAAVLSNGDELTFTNPPEPLRSLAKFEKVECKYYI